MTVKTIRCIALAGICVTSLASCVAAQSTTSVDLLVLPSGESRCEFEPLTARDSANNIALLYHFTDGIAMRNDRDIEMAYDSTGAPLRVALLATELTSTGAKMRPIMVWFGAAAGDSSRGVRFAPGVDRVAVVPGSPGLVPEGWERLSYSDLERVRALVTWLRDNRCRRPPTGSSAPRQ